MIWTAVNLRDPRQISLLGLAVKAGFSTRGPEFNQMSTRNFWQLIVVKSKLSPCRGFVALKQLNPIHEKGP